MVAFASPQWVEQLDRVLGSIEATGAPLRVRYTFLDDDGATAAAYDLVLGDGVGAATVPPDAPAADVAITQPRRVAAAVAAGTASAQQALLDGSITVAGRVTELVAWRRTLDAVDAAMAALRVTTDWS